MSIIKLEIKESYIARWAYSEVLHLGDRVQLIHDDDGGYSLEPIPAEGF